MKAGDIVLVPFPFTDLSSTKIRPALVVSNDQVQGEDIIQINKSHSISKLKEIKHIRSLFMEGDIDVVIKEINNLHITNEELNDDFILLAGQFNSWKKGFLNGTETANSPQINKVKRGLLKIINQLYKDYQE